jgi:signal transduction histidine kinase
MKDMFLATMSHELRTPLNAMIGFLHLMIYSGQMDADNVHMAERSLANTQRLLTLINNILDLSRIATGGLEIIPGAMEPRYVAASLYGDLKLLAQEKGLRLELDMDQALPESINQDESRISQIITNLVTNAIKFTETGVVRMAFKRHDERFVIQVTDSGIGIPQSKQHLIFDDFFQVDASSTRSHQGAGLGLAIVKRMVMLMNGTINVTSQVGQGSIFTIDLPLNLPPYEPGDRRKQAEHVFAKSMTGSNDSSFQPL